LASRKPPVHPYQRRKLIVSWSRPTAKGIETRSEVSGGPWSTWPVPNLLLITDIVAWGAWMDRTGRRLFDSLRRALTVAQ
jgi:hypothetical protein